MTNDAILTAVDNLARVRAQISELRKLEKEAEKPVRAALEKADPDDQFVDGPLFRARLVTQIQMRLDADKVRELLHPNQLRVCEKAITVVKINLTARPTEKVAS